jgi:hypothetical protein
VKKVYIKKRIFDFQERNMMRMGKTVLSLTLLKVWPQEEVVNSK